jgi:hypothetical protein
MNLLWISTSLIAVEPDRNRKQSLKTDEKYEFGSPNLGAIQASRSIDYK